MHGQPHNRSVIFVRSKRPHPTFLQSELKSGRATTQFRISLQSDLLHSCVDQPTASLTLQHQCKVWSKYPERKNAIIFAETLQAACALKHSVTIHRRNRPFVAPLHSVPAVKERDRVVNRYCLDSSFGYEINTDDKLQALLLQICVTKWRGCVPRNASLCHFVVVRTSYSVLTQTQTVQYSLLHT